MHAHQIHAAHRTCIAIAPAVPPENHRPLLEDADGTITRARRLGATIPFGPEDIPGVGRFGVLEDPTGAVLAIMKPLPMEKHG